MADLMHIPVLVKYNYESHAAAGALIGLTTDYALRNHFARITRLAVGVGSALVIGTTKEYLLDKNPHNREIGPWGVGAAAALSFTYSF